MHTLTENRVLQQCKHPFLTVSLVMSGFQINPCQQPTVFLVLLFLIDYDCFLSLIYCCSYFFQELRYSFQTRDRLVFVMEYVNGGEVRGQSYINRGRGNWKHRKDPLHVSTLPHLLFCSFLTSPQGKTHLP